MSNEVKLGATGKFPEGKINPDDQGEIRLRIAFDNASQNLIIDFGAPVVWVGMPPQLATKFANLILKRVKEANPQ